MAIKVGDRVKVYFGAGPQNFKIGKVIITDSDSIIQVLEDKPTTPGYHIVYAHPKQCRKLVKKKKEVNINDPENALKIIQMIQRINAWIKENNIK